MRQITLTLTDCIETVLPAVQAAMDAGEVCQMRNIHFLGAFQLAALGLLVMAPHLKDTTTGALHHAQPGFVLIGIDEQGQTRHLAG